MELTEEVQDLLQRFKLLSKQSQGSIRGDRNFTCSDNVLFDEMELVDVSAMDVSDEERWLHHSPEASARCHVGDLKQWLYEDSKQIKDVSFSSSPSLIKEMHNFNAKKNIDTRTFTRPKKKAPRPSIEKYNEDLFNSKKDFSFMKDSLVEQIQNFTSPLENTLEDISLSKSISESTIEANVTPRKPLHFDLAQPANIFDNILSNGADVDSFQNMSPPSLVNSMSSSTFNNLMENSYIKNDPILREIRDADYSEELLMDYQAPMFQSFTESCSSLNSDTPENFLLKTMGPNFNGTFKKNTSIKDFSDEMKISNSSSNNTNLNHTFRKNLTDEMKSSNSSGSNLNNTYKKDSAVDLSISDVDFNSSLGSNNQHHINDETIDIIHSENIDPNTTVNLTTSPRFNGTYRKKSTTRMSQTFQMLAENEGISPLDMNQTITLIKNDQTDSNQLNKISRKLSYTVNDLNKTQNGTTELTTKNDLNQTTTLYRNSFANSTGSADSLDIISNLSNSSRGSTKMLNMAEVDAIIERQEKSLQIMSTPKPAKSLTKLWETEMISPIVGHKEHLSESDLSSADEYATVRSTLSKASSIASEREILPPDRPTKSLGNLLNKGEEKSNPRSINTVTRGLNSLRGNMRGSYSNLKTADSNLRGSYSNLKSLGSSLKGSYTNLKPVCSNLPHATNTASTNYLKGSNPNLTHVNNQTFNANTTRIVDSREKNEGFKKPFVPKDSNLRPVEPICAVKPQVKVSGLPRPVGTGIPRPVSKIPGPRASSARPIGTVRSNVRIPNKDGNY